MVLELLGWFSAFMLGYRSIQWELCMLPSVERHSLVFISRMLKSDFFSLFLRLFSYSLPNSSIFLSPLPVSRSIKVILDASWFFQNIFQSISTRYQRNLPSIWHITLSLAFAYPTAALVLHSTVICSNSVCSELFLAFQK